MNITTVKDIVEDILVDCEACRDNDNLLTARVWMRQLSIMGYKGSKDYTAILLLDGLYKPEAITRARRKIQEEDKFLRGKVYRGRQAEQTSVKSQIKNWRGRA